MMTENFHIFFWKCPPIFWAKENVPLWGVGDRLRPKVWGKVTEWLTLQLSFMNRRLRYHYFLFFQWIFSTRFKRQNISIETWRFFDLTSINEFQMFCEMLIQNFSKWHDCLNSQSDIGPVTNRPFIEKIVGTILCKCVILEPTLIFAFTHMYHFSILFVCTVRHS